MSRWLEPARGWARTIKRDAVAIWLAARDPRTPWAARVLAICVAAYALSPIDLIPDFIPVLGYIDDLLIVPLGILAVVKMVPPRLMAEFRTSALAMVERPVSLAGRVAVVTIWLALALPLVAWLARLL